MLSRLRHGLRNQEITLVTALVLATTWLFIASRPADPDWHQAFVRSIHELQQVDAALKRDLLLARHGLQPHYDFLNQHLQRMRDLVERLQKLDRSARRDLAEMEPTLRALQASLQAADAGLERFKSSHSTLRNSLAYVSQVLPEMARGNPSDRPGVGPELADFALSVLALIQDPSAERARALAHRVDHLRSLTERRARDRALQTIIAHGDIIARSLPVTQDAVQRLLELPIAYLATGLGNSYLNAYTGWEDLRSTYQALLYVLALFVLVYLIGVYVRLQRQALALEEANHALFQERERALVTLHSITEAVITTGADGCIDFLNPAAASLTGWTLEEASGQPLPQVMRVVDGGSRRPLPDPAVQCLHGAAQTLGDNALLLSRTGREYAVEASVAPIYNQRADVLGTVVVFSDVTDARRMAQRIAHQANHDPLTGLLNRRAFESRVEAVVARTQAEGGEHVLCYVDLDQFKVVNDTCGHAAGDQMLKQISGLLRHSLREADILGRLGGDEFGIVLLDCPLVRGREIVEAMLSALRDWRFAWDGHHFETGASIGVVPVTADASNVGELMSRADIACYAAKDSGRNRLHVHLDEDTELSRRHEELAMVAQISKALEEDRLRLYVQPIRPLSADVHAARRFEVLVRLVDETGGEMAPGRFIPAAERYNLMGSVDRWVIRHTFGFMAQQLASGDDSLHLSINLSGLSLADEDLGTFITEQLGTHGIRAERICFEITETAAIGNLNAATRFMADMKAAGCCFALDDFGSGLSSFGYLKNLPVDYLKIDGSFVRDIVDNDIDRAMVAAITQLAHIMGIQAIAEFVENDTIVAHLRQIGVDYGQGYGLGRPVPLEELAEGALRAPVASGE